MAPESSRKQLEGIVVSAAAQGLYLVELSDGRRVTASMGVAARRATVKVIPGNKVLVSLSVYQPSEARFEVRFG
jgi:translation initiation factor IF-1